MLSVILIMVPITPVAAATYMPPELLEEIKGFISERYVDEITVEELTGITPEEIFAHLDPHSMYYSADVFEKYLERIFGEYAGIGAYVEEREGKIYITQPIEGSPSFKAGLKAGDEIIHVNDVKVKGMTLDEAVTLIRGPEGTKVTIGVMREGASETIRYTMTREHITLKTVSYEIMDDIGYLKITEFNESTYDETLEALAVFKSKKIDRLIIDVRDNPGGMLDSVVDIARLLVESGPILHVEYRDYAMMYQSFATNFTYKEVVVLANEGSASASEILAAAIQDSGAGVVIGQTTYGKGSVQRIYFLDEYGGFKLTEARYLSPNKTVIDGVGVEPNYEVARFPAHVDIGNIVTRRATKDIYQGIRGPEVLGIQQRLQGLGYSISDSRGVFKQGTMEALMAFAKDNGLEEPTHLTVALQEKIYEVFVETLYSQENDQQLSFALDYLRGKVDLAEAK